MKKRKILGLGLAACLAITSLAAPVYAANETTAAVAATASKSYKITKRNIPTYFFEYKSEDNKKIPLYYMNGSDVPYFEITDMVSAYITILKQCGRPEFDLEVKKEGNKVTLTRENGFFTVLDFEDDTIFFWDYDGFFTSSKTKTLLDLIMPVYETADFTFMLKTLESNERTGNTVTLDAGDYDIDFVRRGNKYYIPVQTFSDIFLSGFGAGVTLYNTHSLIFYLDGIESLYNNTTGKYSKLGQVYYGKDGKYATGKVSKTMSEFSVNEFCFAMDTLYGLKKEHNINSFKEVIVQRDTGLNMYSTNAKKIDRELWNLIYQNVDDIHSRYALSSYASGADYKWKLNEKYGQGYARDFIFAFDEELKEFRKKYNPDLKMYEEYGDTAYITFDGFALDFSNLADLFGDELGESNNITLDRVHDTVGLISYSVQQILRKDSPIKNVVLDLSLNGGGAVDAAAYVVAAFLGKASFSVENALSGSRITNDYMCDINFDTKFDKNETLAGKGLNLYCLTTKASFSCGNLVPCIFKEDPHVSIIGQKSGGGACTVGTISTATGTVLDISSNTRLSYIKNGSFYNVDQGAEPDISITKLEHLFDREWLTKYIDDLA
ncbi:MAG TPA: hypothetical protein DDX72_04475 [Ruminococcaceae bacterium]|nr:hypothetical protein [Oscillospiraceae bacterium]